MIPKAEFVKVRQHVQKLQKEYQNETVGQTGLRAVPIELGRSIKDFIMGLKFPGSRQSKEVEADGVLQYLAKQNMIVPHPWGGWMVPQVKEAPACPGKECAEPLVKEALRKII